MPDKNIIIYADNRELKSRVCAVLKNRCDLRPEQLDVADYLLSDNVAVERKTSDDFVSSVIDGRLFKQLSEVKANFRNPVLLIEGRMNSDRIHENALRGALASVAVNYSVPMLWTKTQKESAELLYTIARREQNGAKRPVSVRGSRRMRSMNEVQEFLISGLPNVNTVTAKRLLEHFKTPARVFEADEQQLMEVRGIGKEMAKKVRRVLDEAYEKSILE